MLCVAQELDVDENGVLTMEEVNDALCSVGIQVDVQKLHDCLGSSAVSSDIQDRSLQTYYGCGSRWIFQARSFNIYPSYGPTRFQLCEIMRSEHDTPRTAMGDKLCAQGPRCIWVTTSARPGVYCQRFSECSIYPIEVLRG